MTALRWLVSGLALQAALASAWQLQVDQAGYPADGPKRALVVGRPGDPARVDLIDAATGRRVGVFAMGEPATDPLSGISVAELRLDGWRKPGRYRLALDGELSPEFAIGDDDLRRLQRLLARSFYLQRCGVALDDPETGLRHPADHAEDGRLAHDDGAARAGEAWPAAGGWHDAGDFGKYVATTTVATARLLDAWERRPADFPDGALGIPESGNGRSDLLDEAGIGLRWLLAMQRADGAVYRKLSGAQWPGPVSPDQDRQARFVYGVSSPETAKFAAVMAQAARLPGDAASRARYREAAVRAWRWLETVRDPQQVDWAEGDDRGSGRYLYSGTDRELSLLTDRDDRVWAAAELWLLTGEEPYLRFLREETYLTRDLALFEWKNPAALGVIHLLERRDGALPGDLRERLGAGLREAADAALQRSAGNPWRLANLRFIWGSNKMAAEEGFLLAAAWRMTGRADYRDAARSQLDYLMGENPFGLSFVTGFGERRVSHVAHLYARAAGQDIPGLLVGGPNDLAQDGIAPAGKGILSYTDNDRAYSVNEYAIDYTASLIGLIGILQ